MICRCRSGLGQDVLQLLDLDLDLGQLVDDPLPFQRGQAAQLQSRIAVAWISSTSSRLIRPVRASSSARRPPDQRDDLVEQVERLDQTTQDVRALLGLAQPVSGPPDDDLDLVRDVVAQELGEIERTRNPVDQRQHVGAERLLQLCVLVEVVEDDLCDGVALEHQDQAHAGAARGLVADVGDAGELAFLDQVGDPLGKVVRVHLVRQFGRPRGRSGRACLPRPRPPRASGSSRGRCGTHPGSPADRRSDQRSGSPGP